MHNKVLFCVMLLLLALLVASCGRKRDRSANKSRIEISSNNSRGERRENITESGSRKELTGSEIFKRCKNAVFMIYTSDGSNDYQGSGFFINSNGLAVSNYHVFEGTGKGLEQIKLPGSDVAYHVTRVIANKEDPDFILFQVNCSNVPFIPIAKSKPEIGDRVYAIGSPLGLENTMSDGVVSQWRDKNLMQISVPIDHGSSGGALINEYGEVVGITSGSFADGSQANLNVAWSIDAIKPYIK